MMSTFEIYLIRHGATRANENHLYCGRSDLELSEFGRAELARYKSCYSQIAISAYYHSGLKRTQETAELLFPGIRGYELSTFREFDFGDFELKSHAQLMLNTDYINWINDFENTGCPNGESLPIFLSRVILAWQSLLLTLKSPIALVTHGGVIARLMNYIFPDVKPYYEWQPNCGEGYRLTLLKDSDSTQVIAFSEICVKNA